MKITFIGHSAFLLSDGEYTVAIDPFIEGNPVATHSVEDVKAMNISSVLITHAHGDHIGNALQLAEGGAAIIATAEIGGWAGKNGAQNAIGANIGGTVKQPWGSVYFTPAWHSSSFPDGTYGGMPTGLMIEMGGKRLYFAGDTALFSDMKLIGDHYTMGPEEAGRALDLIRPTDAIPMHYGTFPGLDGDPQVFAAEAQKRGVKAHIVKPGETIEY